MVVKKIMSKFLSKKQENINNDLEKLLFNNTLLEISYFLPKLVDKYIESFSELLLNLDIDNDSLAKPEYFFDSYKEAIETFEYIKPVSKIELKIVLPDTDTFNFKNRLVFIQLLTYGFVGNYLELPKKDYDLLLSRGDLSKQLLEAISTLPSILDEEENDLDFYLLDLSLNIHNIIQQILNKKLVVFPFSNTAPIQIFDEGINYFNINKEKLFDKILNKSIDMLKRRSY